MWGSVVLYVAHSEVGDQNLSGAAPAQNPKHTDCSEDPTVCKNTSIHSFHTYIYVRYIRATHMPLVCTLTIYIRNVYRRIWYIVYIYL